MIIGKNRDLIVDSFFLKKLLTDLGLAGAEALGFETSIEFDAADDEELSPVLMLDSDDDEDDEADDEDVEAAAAAAVLAACPALSLLLRLICSCTPSHG